MSGPTCHAARDGECFWKGCPQLVTYEKRCPLDNECPDCLAGEDAPACVRCNGTGYLETPVSRKDPGEQT